MFTTMSMKTVAPTTAAKPTASAQKKVSFNKSAALAAAVVVTLSNPVMQAHAGLTEDLLASSEANKEMNDKKRAMTSSANFARSRTVTDGSCKFPDNLLGCENAAEFGNVKFLSDDIKLECEGTRSGKICASEGSFAGSRGGSVFGL
ncbi:unnamed protein product [Bathycoccus prasinos]|mmetsp:Transcript_946/g.2959  ORF Transcript_946/g.2959 Transcript_946/m.2959 type:complete len:147 (-) Transcript_946:85-525(-)